MSDYPKKLIEVSIPLKEINEASAREKSIRHGHPSTLHLWWSRKPLATARAVLFCQLVDDPSGYVVELMENKVARKRARKEIDMELAIAPKASPELEALLIQKERERLHQIVKDLVIWENTTNEKVLNKARKEILKSWQRTCRWAGNPEETPLPPVLDPFAGGGSIPLEAQRLGLESHASDLNPVAVLINKAMIEIPPKFSGNPPVNPDWKKATKEEKAATVWKGGQGLAEDVRYYGQWMRKEAEKRIGNLYPKYEITQQVIDERTDLVDAGYRVGDKLTVIAWLWARTVPSPNPALNGKPVPLVSSFWLSKKKGKEAYVEPIVENGEYRFEIRVGVPEERKRIDTGTKTGRGGNFSCIISDTPITEKWVKQQSVDCRLSEKLMAVVCEGSRGRVYLPSNSNHVEKARASKPSWMPTEKMPKNPRWFSPPAYGMASYVDIFTNRQLVALTTFADLVGEAREQVLVASKSNKEQGSPLDSEDGRTLEQGGKGPQAYADAVAVYLGLIQSKCSDYWSSICSWDSSRETPRNTFGRQAIPMIWDCAEANPFSSSSGSYSSMAGWVWKVIDRLPATGRAEVAQSNASMREIREGTIISSDPPYYDNIGYADLSDFFYVWLRRSLRQVLPQAMGGILVPKEEELIASPYRHGGKPQAEVFFLSGMTKVAKKWSESASPFFPTTIYYAFKQAEVKTEGIASTGWATFLEAIIDAGFGVVGTWPVRTEMVNRIGQKANMLASSIVLVCRQRSKDAPMATRREFVQSLQRELPDALAHLLNSNIAPVDLPQSAIGPGMAIFSRFSKIIEADGTTMSMTTALQLINKSVDEVLSEQESEMDEWTRFAVTWYSQYAFGSGPYGDAERIATARNVTVSGVVAAGIIESGGGKVRAFRPDELPGDWDPERDERLTVWEIVHHMIRLLDSEGEQAAAAVLAKIGGLSYDARKLCYQLYTISDNKKWPEEARAYNMLITAWPELSKLAEQSRAPSVTQEEMF